VGGIGSMMKNNQHTNAGEKAMLNMTSK